MRYALLIYVEPWDSTRAELLHRLDRDDEARTAFAEAAQLTDNRVERTHLQRRAADLGDSAT